MQCLHAGVEAFGVESVDGEGAVAALGTSRPTGEPICGELRRVGQRSVHNLHELCVAGGQVHGS